MSRNTIPGMRSLFGDPQKTCSCYVKKFEEAFNFIIVKNLKVVENCYCYELVLLE